MSTSINVANLLKSFNVYNNSFRGAIRYILETSKATVKDIPASPAKDDKSDAAKLLKASIKEAEAYNKAIEDCTAIVKHWGIDGNSLKGKNFDELRARILTELPFVDESGRAVKFAKLPAYLKGQISDYANIFQVVAASWIEAISAATGNEIPAKIYSITTPPVFEDGAMVEGAAGSIVNAEGVEVDSSKYFRIWEREASIRNKVNGELKPTRETLTNDYRNQMISK